MLAHRFFVPNVNGSELEQALPCAEMPTTVVAAASFDDMIALTGYTIFINIAVQVPAPCTRPSARLKARIASTACLSDETTDVPCTAENTATPAFAGCVQSPGVCCECKLAEHQCVTTLTSGLYCA